MTLAIAPAMREDVAAVLQLERQVADAPHWAEAEYAAIASGDTAVRRGLLLAHLHGELVGFAVGKMVMNEAELESVAVRAASRRSGVGRALCAAVIGWAWEQGASRVDLEVRASSAGAIALYSALGFVEVGRRRAYYAGPVDDAVLMRLEGGVL